jgi:hypothetical protein
LSAKPESFDLQILAMVCKILQIFLGVRREPFLPLCHTCRRNLLVFKQMHSATLLPPECGTGFAESVRESCHPLGRVEIGFHGMHYTQIELFTTGKRMNADLVCLMPGRGHDAYDAAAAGIVESVQL